MLFSFSFPVVASAALLLVLLWKIFHRYLEKSPLDNVPGPARSSFLLGNRADFATPKSELFWNHVTQTYGPVSRLHLFLGMRSLLVHDPKALYSILIKDQEHYPKTLVPSSDLNIFLGPGVLTTVGAQHRRQRKALNPVFSVAHLRNMTHIFYSVAHKMLAALKSRVPTDGTAAVLDVNGWMSRTTLEMLGQAGLGYSFDDFSENSNDAYGESIKLFFPVLNRFQIVGFALEQLTYVLPDRVLRSLLRMVPTKNVQEFAHIIDTMAQRSQEIIDEKKAALRKGDDALLHEIGEGKDIMSICLKANMAASQEEKLTDEELLAQMSTFILAGMDTTSNAFSRILHQLAKNPAVQEKLRAEILEARNGPGSDSDLPYDDLVKLPYLEAVCRETLRVYAPVTLSARHSSKDMLLPLSNPLRLLDGTTVNELFVPKETLVILNNQASNINPELWGEDASEWKPERWLKPLPAAIEDARVPGVYSNLMTFSGGVRSCIGFKFSQLEMKIVLYTLLANFSFELTDEPITWNTSAVNYPTMGEESDRPEMLLKVTAL